jgi:hypothetical protein
MNGLEQLEETLTELRLTAELARQGLASMERQFYDGEFFRRATPHETQSRVSGWQERILPSGDCKGACDVKL